MTASDHLSNSATSRADFRGDPDNACLWVAEAQVHAAQAIAAAIERLAEAVEALNR